MARKVQPRPSESVLMALVARRHYLQGESKSAIADALGLSRFRIARLLNAARETGVVRIEVGIPGPIDVGLSAELREGLGLEHAIVIDVSEIPEPALMRRLGQTTVRLLAEIVRDGEALGLASARTLMGGGEELQTFPRCRVVQLTGALYRPDAWDVIEGIRKLTRVGGGPAYIFYAPIIAPDVDAALAYQRQADVARAFDMVSELSVAVVGVGAWRPGLSTIHDSVSAEERRHAANDGVFTETAGLLLDRDGQAVQTPLQERLLAPPIEQVKSIPTVIGPVFDAAKAQAVLSAIRGGVVNAIVTHRELAEAILNSSARSQ